jgi:glycosyltransferase involved in cell wall biosynthesis
MSTDSIFAGPKIHPPFHEGVSVITKSVMNIVLGNQLAERVHLVTTRYHGQEYQIRDSAFDQEKLDYEYLKKRELCSCSCIPTSGNRMTDALNLVHEVCRIEFGSKAIVHSFGLSHLFPIFLKLVLKLQRKHGSIIYHYIFEQDINSNVQLNNIAKLGCIDVVAPTSNSMAIRLVGKGMNDNCFFVIPPPIDTSHYRIFRSKETNSGILPQASKPSERFEHFTHRILYAGPVEPNRFPYWMVLKSIKELKDSGLDVCLGIATRDPEVKYAPMLKRIRAEAERFDIRDNIVIFKRALNEYEKIIVFNMSHCLIQPMMPALDYKPVSPPLTILEAMACGLTVVSTHNQYVVDVIVHNENGLLFNLNQSSITEKLYTVISDSTLRKRLSTNGRQMIERYYSKPVVAERLRELYCSVFDA